MTDLQYRDAEQEPEYIDCSVCGHCHREYYNCQTGKRDYDEWSDQLSYQAQLQQDQEQEEND